MQNHKTDQLREQVKNGLKENVYSDKTAKTGMAGFIEFVIRKFRTASFLLALLPIYGVAIIAMGLSASPGVYLVSIVMDITTGWVPLLRFPAISTMIISAYFIYGFFLIFIIPFFNWLLPFRLKPFRGNYFSLESIPWYIHNALTYSVRYTFLDFITPTPLNTLFYRMMGMKIGKNSHINTTNISDPCMIEIGNRVTIGGSAHLLAHYGQHGYLIISRIKIGDNATIGIKATVMGDTEIGEGAVIAPHEVILPKTSIPAGRIAARNRT